MGQQYNPYQQSPSNQLIETPQVDSPLKAALGSAWQGILGFSNKTKEVVGDTKNQVVTGISSASSNVASGGAGLWAKTKESLDNVGKSMFESQPQQTGQNDYSLSSYGVPPPPPGQQQGYYGQQGPPPPPGQQQGLPPQPGYQPRYTHPYHPNPQQPQEKQPMQ